jgi:ribonuclease HI
MSITNDQAGRLRECIRNATEHRVALTAASIHDVNAYAELNAAIEALTAADDVTPGWMKVPCSMTEAMMQAAVNQWQALGNAGIADSRMVVATVWKAALDNSPKALPPNFARV